MRCVKPTTLGGICGAATIERRGARGLEAKLQSRRHAGMRSDASPLVCLLRRQGSARFGYRAPSGASPIEYHARPGFDTGGAVLRLRAGMISAPASHSDMICDAAHADSNWPEHPNRGLPSALAAWPGASVVARANHQFSRERLTTDYRCDR